MKLTVDRNIYSDKCISKTIYSFSKDYSFARSLVGEVEVIEVAHSDKCKIDDDFEFLFYQVLNDYKTREIIAEETKNIRTILYAKAFADCEDFNDDIE